MVMCFHLGLLFRLKDHGLKRVCGSVQLAAFVKRDEGEENEQFTHLIANLPQGREKALNSERLNVYPITFQIHLQTLCVCLGMDAASLSIF